MIICPKCKRKYKTIITWHRHLSKCLAKKVKEGEKE